MIFRWSENVGCRVLIVTQNRSQNFAEKKNLVKITKKTEKKSISESAKKLKKTTEKIKKKRKNN